MKIGCVPYGHAKPFSGAWAGRGVVWDHPKELVGRLKSGEVDVALVPVWEVLTNPGYRVIDGVAVGSKGEVRSVAVFHDKPLEECESITLTQHSMTSVQLWRLVAGKKMKLNLKEAAGGEAKLLIGDEALKEWRRKKGKGMTDLGQAWWDWTGKPFVFAVWAVSPKAKVGSVDFERFRQACLAGIACREDLAEGEEEREYLTRCIQYGLGSEEKEGMMEFANRSGIQEVKVEWV
jgi:chorismate dehydratase